MFSWPVGATYPWPVGTRHLHYLFLQLDHWVAKHGSGTSHSRPRKSAFLHFYSKHLPEAELQASGKSQQADSCRTEVRILYTHMLPVNEN